MIAALVPAAGRSERMGRPKLLLPFAGRKVIEQVIATLQSIGLQRILVVAPADADELLACVRRSGAAVLPLPQPTQHMRETVGLGLEWIDRCWQPAAEDDWLLVPADHPELDGNVVAALLAARANACEFLCHVPTFQGRRGHPVLFRWPLAAALNEFPRDRGINEFVRSLGEQVHELPVESPSIVADLDTPEDYARLLAEHGRRFTPDANQQGTGE